MIEVDELRGYHLEQAVRYQTELGYTDPTLIKRAGDQLAVAGRRALSRSDWRAAINLLERALTVTGRQNSPSLSNSTSRTRSPTRT